MRVAVSMKGGVLGKVRTTLAADADLEPRGRGPVQATASDGLLQKHQPDRVDAAYRAQTDAGVRRAPLAHPHLATSRSPCDCSVANAIERRDAVEGAKAIVRTAAAGRSRLGECSGGGSLSSCVACCDVVSLVARADGRAY
jgi:hypothetical protein